MGGDAMGCDGFSIEYISDSAKRTKLFGFSNGPGSFRLATTPVRATVLEKTIFLVLVLLETCNGYRTRLVYRRWHE